MAWGINAGILDGKTYRPVVEKAWAALLAARKDDGFLGYVQGVGAEPMPVNARQHTWYGNGAFLMAATQMADLAPLNLPPKVNCQPHKHSFAASLPPLRMPDVMMGGRFRNVFVGTSHAL